MSLLAPRQYPCYEHLSLSLYQLSFNMHRQSRQCLAACEPCQVCTCTNSQCLRAAWSSQTVGFPVKQAWAAIALVTAPAACAQMPMHTCFITMPYVVHTPSTCPSSCLSALPCCLVWYKALLEFDANHGSFLPVAGVLHGVVWRDSPCK